MVTLWRFKTCFMSFVTLFSSHSAFVHSNFRSATLWVYLLSWVTKQTHFTMHDMKSNVSISTWKSKKKACQEKWKLKRCQQNSKVKEIKKVLGTNAQKLSKQFVYLEIHHNRLVNSLRACSYITWRFLGEFLTPCHATQRFSKISWRPTPHVTLFENPRNAKKIHVTLKQIHVTLKKAT